MRSSTAPIALSLAFAAAAPFPAVAADKVSVKEWIKKYDRNGDDRLDRGEFIGGYDLFVALDADKDQYLDRKDLSRKGVPELLAEGESMRNIKLVTLDERKGLVDIVAFDENLDGRISPREFERYVFALADQDTDGDVNMFEAKFIAQWSTFAPAFKTAAEVMQRFDKNKDGVIVENEFKTDKTEFKLRDKDRSGQLTADELENRPTGKGLQAFASFSADGLIEKFDENGDGKLDRGEVPGGDQGNFGRVDRDNDGEVSRDELDGVLKYAKASQMSSIDSDFIRRFDLDENGRVERKEFPGPDNVFERLDTNGDGYVSKSDGRG